MSRSTRLPQEQRRSQLVACAVKVFAEHGIGAATHALVAADANVSVPTVFFYFNTREILVDVVLGEIERLYLDIFGRASKSTGPAAEVLFGLTREMTQSADRHPFHWRVYLEWSIAVRADSWTRYLRLSRRMLKVLTQLIERGQQEGDCRPDLIAEDEAEILHAASYALAQMKLTGASPSRIERFQQSMLKTMLTVQQPAKVKAARSSAKAARLRRTVDSP